jgi:hypothetical protein
MRSGTSSSGFSPAWPPDFGGLLDAAGGPSSWSGVAGTTTFPSERTCNHIAHGDSWRDTKAASSQVKRVDGV